MHRRAAGRGREKVAFARKNENWHRTPRAPVKIFVRAHRATRFFPHGLIVARPLLADDEVSILRGLPSPPLTALLRPGDTHTYTHTRAVTLTCTRGSTASSTRSESSALSFCTRPLIIKSRGWILFTALPCHLCVSSARHQVAMLDVKAYHRGVPGPSPRYVLGGKACAYLLAVELPRT